MAMLRERAVPRGPQEGELRVWARTARTGRWLGEGFKGLLCGDVSLPRWLTPWPLPARGNRAPFPPASPPSDRTRAPYLGKGTKSEQSVGGCPRHSPRASGMERAGTGQRAGGWGWEWGDRRERPFMDWAVQASPASGLGLLLPLHCSLLPGARGGPSSRGSGQRRERTRGTIPDVCGLTTPSRRF